MLRCARCVFLMCDYSSLRLTECKRLPRSLCGAGCSYQEEEEQCHDNRQVSLARLPQETCDVQPQKTCRFVTKLVPRLKPVQRCSSVPRQVCNRKYRKVTTTLIISSLTSCLLPGEEGEARAEFVVREDGQSDRDGQKQWQSGKTVQSEHHQQGICPEGFKESFKEK